MSTRKTSPYRTRRQRLASAFDRAGVSAALITHAPDIRYLTGFHGADSWLVVTRRSAVIVSDFRFEEELAAVDVRVHIRKADIVSATAGVLGGQAGPVAVQAEHVSVSLRRRLSRAIGAKRLKNTTGLVGELRLIKDASEIRLIKKAVGIQEAALEAVLADLTPGLTEIELAAWLEFEMRTRGSDEPAFDVIIAARANGSLPHAIPGKTTTASGKPVLIDWGATVGGYRSDMTRTFSLGRWSRAMREIYDVVLEAQLAGLAAIGPGVRCAAVDRASRDIIDAAGYGDRFGHGLGHGVGLDIHEAPRVAGASTEVLEPGMVITVEPGVYLPGAGGVRIEDIVVVTDRGCRNLSTLPKDIDWATR